jgi:hypothetical protein
MVVQYAPANACREQDRESKRPVLFEFGHEVCQISISVSVCTIDLFGRINTKLGGINSLPRSSVPEKLESSPFMVMRSGLAGHTKWWYNMHQLMHVEKKIKRANDQYCSNLAMRCVRSRSLSGCDN